MSGRLSRGLVAAVAGVALLGSGGCYASAKTGQQAEPLQTQNGAAAAPTVQPTGLEVARGLAEAELGMLAGGDWSGAWEMWTATAKAAMSKDAFIELQKACQPKLGVLYVIQDVKPAADSSVTVTWKRANATGTGTMKYENGSWKYEPDAKLLADYKLGAKALIAKRQAAKTCGEPQ